VIVLLNLVSRDESLSLERPPWGTDITIPTPFAHRHYLAMVACKDALQAADSSWPDVRIKYVRLADNQGCER
jgi:hypothetical protein